MAEAASDSTSVRFLTGKYVEADVGVFLLHKNAQFRKDFLMEANYGLSYDLVSFSRVHSVWEITTTIGVGRQHELVFFDPRWVSIGIAPSIEYRLDRLIAQVGLDRRCFHEVDQAPQSATVYWTEPYLTLGSTNMRLAEYMERLFGDETADLRNQTSWYGRIGWFVGELPGYSPALTSGGHDYAVVATAVARYAPFRFDRWATSLASRFDCHFDETARAFWTGEIEVHQTYRGDGLKVTMFGNLNLFDRQKAYKNMNRDHLAQVGLRFF